MRYRLTGVRDERHEAPSERLAATTEALAGRSR